MWIIIVALAVAVWFIWGEFRGMRREVIRPVLRIMKEIKGDMVHLTLWNFGQGSAFCVGASYSIPDEENEAEEIIIENRDEFCALLEERFVGRAEANFPEIIAQGGSATLMTLPLENGGFTNDCLAVITYVDQEGNNYETVQYLNGHPL